MLSVLGIQAGSTHQPLRRVMLRSLDSPQQVRKHPLPSSHVIFLHRETLEWGNQTQGLPSPQDVAVGSPADIGVKEQPRLFKVTSWGDARIVHQRGEKMHLPRAPHVWKGVEASLVLPQSPTLEPRAPHTFIEHLLYGRLCSGYWRWNTIQNNSVLLEFTF